MKSRIDPYVYAQLNTRQFNGEKTGLFNKSNLIKSHSFTKKEIKGTSTLNSYPNQK